MKHDLPCLPSKRQAGRQQEGLQACLSAFCVHSHYKCSHAGGVYAPPLMSEACQDLVVYD